MKALDSIWEISVQLMTNNPRKVEDLTLHGINVSGRIPLIVPPNPHNEFYLETKASKSGHLIDLNGKERLLEQDDRPVLESAKPQQIEALRG